MEQIKGPFKVDIVFIESPESAFRHGHEISDLRSATLLRLCVADAPLKFVNKAKRVEVQHNGKTVFIYKDRQETDIDEQNAVIQRQLYPLNVSQVTERIRKAIKPFEPLMSAKACIEIDQSIQALEDRIRQLERQIEDEWMG